MAAISRLDQLFRPVEALRGRGVHVQRLGLLGQHLVGEVADRDAQMRVAEVDADDDARVAAERDAAGPRPPAEVGVTSTVPPSFSSRTMLETVAADSPVRPGDLRLRQRPGQPHRAYDPFQIGPVQRRLRPRSLHDDHSCVDGAASVRPRRMSN